MRQRELETANQYAWIVSAIAALMVGGLVWCILAMNQTMTATTAPIAAAPAVAATFSDAVGAGNRLYDARRYEEAIPYYQKALTLNPSDVDVSTDLGTGDEPHLSRGRQCAFAHR